MAPAASPTPAIEDGIEYIPDLDVLTDDEKCSCSAGDDNPH